MEDLIHEFQQQRIEDNITPTDLRISPQILHYACSWKAKVAHESRNAVVKILTSVVEFDWEQPYRRADDAQAIGSGFLVSDDGLIVTNAHVVEEASKIWITVSLTRNLLIKKVPSEGEKRFNAEVIGVCFDADLALLRSKEAPVRKKLEFGDSDLGSTVFPKLIL